MENKIRILIVDDHPVVRHGLHSMLETILDMEVVGEARDGIEAVQFAQALKPDVILMDLVMPKKNGLEAIAEIWKENHRVRILVLTSFPDDNKIYSAIKAGACGYLLKDSSPEELLQAIRDVHLGRASLPPEVTNKLLNEIQQSEEIGPGKMVLTKRETEILQLAVQGLSNSQIAAELVISEGTVRYHISNILGKLNLQNRTQAVLYALEHGLAELKPKLTHTED
jgi:two-component system, NarL family, response regulator LiaR